MVNNNLICDLSLRSYVTLIIMNPLLHVLQPRPEWIIHAQLKNTKNFVRSAVSKDNLSSNIKWVREYENKANLFFQFDKINFTKHQYYTVTFYVTLHYT